MRVNIQTVIIPWKNKKDLLELKDDFQEKINFVPVKNIEEVLEIALVGWLEQKSSACQSPLYLPKTSAPDTSSLS